MERTSNMSVRIDAHPPTALEHPYSLPDWFVLDNVKSPQDLKGVASQITLIHESPASGGGDDPANESKLDARTTYGVHQHEYEAIRDSLASTFVRDDNGVLRKDKHGVIIQTNCNHGTDFISKYVTVLAKDLHVTLVRVSLEDFMDLAWEYDHQSQQQDERHFDSQFDGNSRRAYDDDANLIDAARRFVRPMVRHFSIDSPVKVQEKEIQRYDRAFRPLMDIEKPCEGDCCNESAFLEPGCRRVKSHPVLIYLRDAKVALVPKYGQRILKRLKTLICKARESGKAISLVVGFSECESVNPGEVYEPFFRTAFSDRDINCKRLREKTGISKSALLTASPPSVPTDDTVTRPSQCIPDTVTRRLKCLLRFQVGTSFPAGMLYPSTTWDLVWDERLAILEWSDSVIETAAAQVVGRSWTQENLGIPDVKEILERLAVEKVAAEKEKERAKLAAKVADEERKARLKDENADSEAGCGNNAAETETVEKQLSRGGAEELKQILDTAQLDKREQVLLDSVVNVDDLQTTTYDDVVLNKNIKDIMQHLIYMSKMQPDAKSQFLLSQVSIKGALLYGPPGTGKTHLSRAIASTFNSRMLAIDGAVLVSKWVGETAKFIRAAFTLAEKIAPCVLFMDEVDALFLRRSSEDRQHERSAVTQFLHQMDGLANSRNAPFVLVATNRPMDLDAAFLRRLPQKIFFQLPDRVSRAKILRLFLKDEDIDAGVCVDALAVATEGYSGSDLRNLCAEAALMWMIEQSSKSTEAESNGRIQESVAKDLGVSKVCLTRAHFDKALWTIRPTVSEAELGTLEAFANRFNAVQEVSQKQLGNEKDGIVNVKEKII